MADPNLVQILNRVWAGVIKAFEVDFNHSTIYLEIDIKYNDKVETHKFKFLNVDMFCYNELERSGEWEFTELTSIQYYSNPTKNQNLLTRRFPKRLKRKDFVRKPNFVLELWSTELLIHASSLSVDGVLYQEL